jgi:hypothetical protein
MGCRYSEGPKVWLHQAKKRRQEITNQLTLKGRRLLEMLHKSGYFY